MLLRQDRNFSTRLLYANKKIQEIHFSMMNTKYETTEDMIIKFRSIKGKTKLTFHQNVSD